VAIGTNNFLKTSPKRDELTERCRRKVKKEKIERRKMKENIRRKSNGTKNVQKFS
jgi:hypothetical protein